MNQRPLIPRWLLELELEQSEFKVLMALWHRANKEYLCWPSRETLEADARLSHNTVGWVLASLKERGLIEIQRRRRQSNLYVMRIPEADVDVPNLGQTSGALDHPNGESRSPKSDVPDTPQPLVPRTSPVMNTSRGETVHGVSGAKPPSAAGCLSTMASAEDDEDRFDAYLRKSAPP